MVDQVRQATSELAEALSRGDAAAAALLYADDGKLLTPAAELIAGRSQIEAYWRVGISCGLSSVELAADELSVSGHVAVEVGRYTLLLTSAGGSPAFDRGKYLALHRRLPDGSWRRAVEVFNPDVPQARPDVQEER
jgi:ketosteroid isomerase-like protein